MSTSPRGETPRASNGERRFRRAFLGTLLTLAVLVTALGFAGATQGPRLTNAEIDTVRSVQLAGQSLRIELNQAVKSVDAAAVVVTPKAAVNVSHEASTITVTFTNPLRYASEYTVTLRGVVGAFTPSPSTISHSFRTADEFAYTLHRRSHEGELDAVLRRPLGEAGEQEIVFRAPRIKSFAQHAGSVAAITIDDDGNNSVYVVIPGSEGPQKITFPTVGSVRALAASTTNPLLGFVVTSTEIGGERMFENALFTLDLSGAVETGVKLAEHPDGSPLSVMDWAFVPGTMSVIVQDSEQTLFLLDLAGITPITPIGRHGELRGFVPGTTTLVVADPDHGSLIDLAAGATTTLELPKSELANDRYLGKVTVLGTDGEHLLELSSPASDFMSLDTDSVVVRVGEERSAKLYAPPANSRILRHCVSPNGQFAAVETIGASSAPDRYPGSPGYTNTLTMIVEIDSARVVSGLSGGSSDWCGV